jgi:hypothetical protein
MKAIRYILLPKLLFALVAFLLLSFAFAMPQNFDKPSNVEWSKTWFPNNNARIKGAVMVDEKGTLLVVGQHFTERDSINAPSTLAKISPSGEMVAIKHMGRTGRYKGDFKKKNDSYYLYEDRLVQIFKTHDDRIFAFGYKTFPIYKRKLWIVELNENLEILQDTTYMNLAVSDIGKMAAFDSPNGWYLISRQYYEERELSRYRIAIFEFNNKLECLDSTSNVVADEDGRKLCMMWMNSVAVVGEDLIFTGQSAFTHDTLDEDYAKKTGYLMKFNMITKKTSVLFSAEPNAEPRFTASNGSEYCILYTHYNPTSDTKINPKHLVVCYDSIFNEIWRDAQQLSKFDKPDYLVLKNGNWHALGTTYDSPGTAFYEITYDSKGAMIKKEISTPGTEREAVMEIDGPENSKYRLYIDNGWRIDKLID